MRILKYLLIVITIIILTGCTIRDIEIVTRTHAVTPPITSAPKTPTYSPIKTPEPTKFPGVLLSDKELEFFTEYLNQVENRAFLMCEFEYPQEVYLSTVLKGGAGFNNEISKKEKTILKLEGYEINIDMVKVTSNQIHLLLLSKLGIPMGQGHTSELLGDGWFYIDEYDSYYTYQGMSDHVNKIIYGVRTNAGVIVINYVTDSKDNGVVMLLETNDGYLFMSNK